MPGQLPVAFPVLCLSFSSTFAPQFGGANVLTMRHCSACPTVALLKPALVVHCKLAPMQAGSAVPVQYPLPPRQRLWHPLASRQCCSPARIDCRRPSQAACVQQGRPLARLGCERLPGTLPQPLSRILGIPVCSGPHALLPDTKQSLHKDIQLQIGD